MELEAAPRSLDVKDFARARAPEALALFSALKEIHNHNVGLVPRHLRRRTSSYKPSRRRMYLRQNPSAKKEKKKKKSKEVEQVEKEEPPPRERKRKRQEVPPPAEVEDSSSAVPPLLPLPPQGDEGRKLPRWLRRKLEIKNGGLLRTASDGTLRLPTHVWHAKRFTMTKIWGYRLALGRSGRGRGSRAVLKWAKSASLLHDASFHSAIQLSGPEELLLKALKLVFHPNPYGRCDSEDFSEELSGACFSITMLHRLDMAPHGMIAPVIYAWCPHQLHASESAEENKSDQCRHRHLLIWVHGAAFEEAYQLLQDICCKMNEEVGEVSLECLSRKGALGRLDIIGLQSLDVLRKVLRPIPRRGLLGEKSIEEATTLFDLLDLGGLPNRAVVNMNVLDPRITRLDLANCSGSVTTTSKDLVNLDPCPISALDGDTVVEDEHTLVKVCNMEGHDRETSSSNRHLDHCFLAALDMDKDHMLRPPISDKALCKMRHKQRLSFLNLETVPDNKANNENKGFYDNLVCSIMLMKHSDKIPSACGWSIILPLSWLWTFWVPLVLSGGHAIGLRERHWLSTAAGMPAFPQDFPDSCAHVYGEYDQKESCSQTPLNTFSKAVTLYKDGKNPFQDLRGIPENDGPLFIARTGLALRKFMLNSNSENLLIFPEEMQNAGRLRTAIRGICEGSLEWKVKAKADEVNEDGGDACFVRVLVCPTYKGVVKEGAILCMPTEQDFLTWLHLGRKFKLSVHGPAEGSTGNSASNAELTNLRRPIGFATSAAPRGSASDLAIGFCDVLALGRIRGQQWVEKCRQHESDVFLLLHNERSSIYLPALASIPLEERKDTTAW